MSAINSDVALGNTGKALEGLDPSFLKENQQLVTAYNNIQWDNIDSLNALIGAIEQVVLKYKNPNDLIKLSVETIYYELLNRYPLFFGYWKRFTAVEYQLFGLQKSIDTLKSGVEAFPTSLDLWCDYLNVLCTNNATEINLIRGYFSVAKELVGYQFLSHPFWDKYIEFETKNKEFSKLKEIYEELVKIPLHQYAKYGTAYRDFLRSRIDNNAMVRLNTTIKNTQKAVMAIWPYESKIKQNFFTLAPVADAELKNWYCYLEFLRKNESANNFTYEFTKSVFERCLIPCLYYEQFWIEFTKWLETKDSLKMQQMVEIFEKGLITLPSTSKSFRFHFLSYLKKNLKRDKSYILTVFTQAIASYMKLWPGESSLLTEYLSVLKRCEFGSSIEQNDKEILSRQTSYSKFLESAITNYFERHIDRNIPLQDMLNDNNVPIVVVELIKSTWLILKNTMQTRKYFNLFGKNPILRSSISFWLTYYKFEKFNQNFTKLNRFINELGINITLPTTIINDILADYQAFYLANSNISNYQDYLVTIDLQKERGFIDPILSSQFKINNPHWTPDPNRNLLDWQKTKEYKENGHPGIIDEKPHISNIIVEHSSNSFGNIAPPLPTFRNLEKINQSVKFDDVLDREYLNLYN